MKPNQPKEENQQEALRLERFHHRGKDCVGLFFEYDKELIARAREMNARWSQTRKCWYLPDDDSVVYRIISKFKGRIWVDATAMYSGRPPQAKNPAAAPPPCAKTKQPQKPSVKVPQEYIDVLKTRGYSPNTLKSYSALFRKFMVHVHPTPLSEVTEEQIKKYLLHLVDSRGLCYNTQNQVINAIKFYYERVLRQPKKVYWIDRPRKPSKLPEVISAEQVKAMLEKVEDNPKHWCLIAIIYSAGLRRSEVLNLRKKDVDPDRKQIMVRGGKGKKDRQTLLSGRLIEKLDEYYEKDKPHYWVFEGSTCKKYSGSSVGNVVKDTAKKVGIAKNVTPHVLRHSFATHMMDGGTDTRIIQRVLGHNSILTTSQYTHVSTKDFGKLKSPLDGLFDDK